MSKQKQVEWFDPLCPEQFNKKKKVYPGYWNESEFVKPIGVPLKKWYEQLEFMNETEIPLRKREMLKQYMVKKKCSQTMNVLSRVALMKNPVFVTCTISDKYIDRPMNEIVKLLRQWLETKIDLDRWVLVTDFGSDEVYTDKKGVEHVGTERPHFHGFIDIGANVLIKNIGAVYKGHWKKQPYSVYRSDKCPVGAISINKNTTNDRSFKKQVEYCTKYITKDVKKVNEFDQWGHKKEHKIYGSRTQSNDLEFFALNVFGADLLEVIEQPTI